MSYPQGIAVELRSIQIIDLELITRVDDGSHAIFLFYKLQPLQHILLKLLQRFIATFLDVENRRQVTIEQMHLLQIELSLCLRVTIRFVVMIGSSH